jgi:hypothetical protein
MRVLLPIAYSLTILVESQHCHKGSPTVDRDNSRNVVYSLASALVQDDAWRAFLLIFTKSHTS